MARKPKPIPETIDPQIDNEAFGNAVAAFNSECEASQAAKENAVALAGELGYEGAISVNSLESEIRFYQRRSVEGVLELGKRLLILKELTPHGEFTNRVEALDINQNLARKFMNATLKFSNRYSSTVLKAASTQTKLLELIALDDTEIEELESGESVRGLTLDKIETMSVSELKKALRESEANLEASRKTVAAKDEKLNALDEELNKKRITVVPASEEEKALRAEASQIAFTAEAEIRGNLREAFSTLTENAATSGSDHRQFMSGLICNIERALRTVQGEYDLDASPSDDPTPAYMKDDDAPLEIPEHIRSKKS